MASTEKWNQDEINEFIFSQLETINAVLSSIVPGFNNDIESFSHNCIENCSLSAESKAKIKQGLSDIKTRHKPQKQTR